MSGPCGQNATGTFPRTCMLQASLTKRGYPSQGRCGVSGPAMSFARLRNSAFACMTLAGAALGFLPVPALSAPEASQAPLAVAAEVKAEGPRTRLTFTLSEPVEARPFVLERPDR